MCAETRSSRSATPRDDQAETILHRIIRGTGPRGLTGIPALRRAFINSSTDAGAPIASRVSQRRSRTIWRALKQPFREDASNDDLSRTRARIRHDLLPKLAAEYNPHVALALVRLGSLASSLENAFDSDLRDLERSAVITRARDCVVLKHGLSCGRFRRFSERKSCDRVWRSAGWPEANMSAQAVAAIGGPG